MKKNNIIILSNLLILFAMTVCAYGAEAKKPSPPAQPSPPAVAAPLPAPQAPPAAPSLSSTYSYNPLGKPDPFKPFIDVQILPAKKEVKKIESIFPLQRADVENFKLVGIVGDDRHRVAMVEDATKKFYPLFIGTRIGLHNGKVTDILADRVTVDEVEGKKVKRIVLKLRKNI